MGEQAIKKAKKRNKLALISWILSSLYLIYLIIYFGSEMGGEGPEAAGAAIATALVFPHMLVVGIGLIFNILGYFLNNRAFILVGAILYSISILLFMMYFMFVIIQMILSFVAFAKMKTEKA